MAAFFGYFLIYFPGIGKHIAALPGSHSCHPLSHRKSLDAAKLHRPS
jgi:hypothetical protein